MDKRLYDAFDNIRAENELKEKTEQQLKQVIFAHSISKRKYRSYAKRFITAAASFVLLFTAVFSGLYFSPSAYIDIDVNPALAVTVNRFGYIIEANALNNYADAIIQESELKHKKYEECIEILLEAMIINGYIDQNGLLSITLHTNDSEKESDIINKLNSMTSGIFSLHHINLSTEIYPVSEEVLLSAHEHHISPAKYLAIAELQTLDDTVSFETSSEHSIGQIRQRIHEHESENESGEQSRHHQNNSDDSNDDDSSNDTQPEEHSGKHSGQGQH